MTKILISVFLMALVTYLPRVLPMVLFKKKIESKKPKDYETILVWLHMVQKNYKGFYILGV